MSIRQPQPQVLLRDLARVGKAVERGIITGPEFINKAFSEFANAGQVYPEVIPGLWALVPGDIRAEFADAVQDALRPDYRFREFWIGPGPQGSEEERQRESKLRTDAVRAWAAEFVRLMVEGKQQTDS